MPERELAFKVTAKTDKSGFVAAKREFREASREIDKAKPSVQKFNEQMERLQQLQQKGLLTSGQVRARTGQLQQERIREQLQDVPGGGRLAGLLGNRAPLVGALGVLTGAVLGLRRIMELRTNELTTAEELGVDPVAFSRLRSRFLALGVSEQAAERAARQVSDRAFLRRVLPATELQRTIDRLQQVPEGNLRARRAQAMLGSRVFGNVDLTALGRDPVGAATQQQIDAVRFRREASRNFWQNMLQVFGEIFSPAGGGGVRDGIPRTGLEGRLNQNRQPQRIIIEDEGTIDNL